MRVWNFNERCLEIVLEEHSLNVMCIAFTHKGKFIVSGGGLNEENELIVWNFEKKK